MARKADRYALLAIPLKAVDGRVIHLVLFGFADGKTLGDLTRSVVFLCDDELHDEAPLLFGRAHPSGRRLTPLSRRRHHPVDSFQSTATYHNYAGDTNSDTHSNEKSHVKKCDTEVLSVSHRAEFAMGLQPLAWALQLIRRHPRLRRHRRRRRSSNDFRTGPSCHRARR